MTKKIIYLLACIVLVGCDEFPGPTLVNEFPTEIKVSILYGDGTKYSELWPPCRRVSIGAYEIGRFGLVAKDVSVDEIIIEVENEEVHFFDKEAIDALEKRASDERGYPGWVLERSGVRFSTDRNCPSSQVQK